MDFLWLVKTEFSSNPSSRPVYTGVVLFSNRVLLFRCFLLLVESISEIRCYQICSNFPVTNSGSRVFIKSFMTTSLYRFRVNFKPCIFIQMVFLCCWKTWLKLGVYQFYSIFSVPNSGIRVFIKFFITTSVYRFWLNFETCVLIEIFLFCC